MRKRNEKWYRLYSMMRMGIIAIFAVVSLAACDTEDATRDLVETKGTIKTNYVHEYNQQLREVLEKRGTGTSESTNNNQGNKLTSTPEPQATEKVEEKPDESDIYFAAMESIDDAISESSKTKKYSGYSYKIKDKKIEEWDNGIGTTHIVSYIIEFNGISQKFRIDVYVAAMKDYLWGGYTYYINDTKVNYSGNTF